MKFITIARPGHRLEGSILLPSSKSISNRLLIIRELSGTKFPISGLSDSGDTALMTSLLGEISQPLKKNGPCLLNTGNAGTVMRFLTSFLSVKAGEWILTGTDRMKLRPVGPLVDALRQLGAEIGYLEKPGFPPLHIVGKSIPGGSIEINASQSSQFVTALLLTAPCMPRGLSLSLTGRPSSFPYIDMTINLMRHFGIDVGQTGTLLKVSPRSYSGKPFTVERDWSSAAFWYEIAALAGSCRIELPGLRHDSMQGDAIIRSLGKQFGVESRFEEETLILTGGLEHAEEFLFDFTGYPDLAPAVIGTCAGLGINSCFSGLETLKFKESDRISALQNEFGKLGIRLNAVKPDVYCLPADPRQEYAGSSPDVSIETHNDHRIAMAVAPLALRFGKIRIANPGVVEKSYPDFWEDLKKAGFGIFAE
jgi:3-phosphoshikimate 1-carboxyvinyltransferase